MQTISQIDSDIGNSRLVNTDRLKSYHRLKTIAKRRRQHTGIFASPIFILSNPWELGLHSYLLQELPLRTHLLGHSDLAPQTA